MDSAWTTCGLVSAWCSKQEPAVGAVYDRPRSHIAGVGVSLSLRELRERDGAERHLLPKGEGHARQCFANLHNRTPYTAPTIARSVFCEFDLSSNRAIPVAARARGLGHAAASTPYPVLVRT